ncbi:hypothetical protein ACP3V3_19820 [Vibrio sp. PNB22_3_1]
MKNIYFSTKNIYFSTHEEAHQFINNQELYQAHRDAESNILRELGARYFKALKIASKSGFKYQKTDAYKSVKNGKKITQKRFLELVDVYCNEVLQYRENVRRAKFKFESETAEFRVRAESNKPRVNVDGRALERAELRKIARIKEAVKENLDLSVSGYLSLNVTFTNEPVKVNYDSYTEKGAQYSRNCTYRKNNLIVSATLPNCWWSRVAKHDLIIMDGLFNLDVSTPLVGEFGESIEVRAATWLVKSRGTSYNVVKGFIARDLSQRFQVAFHGKTLKSALQGLHRKLDLQDAMSITTNDTNKIIERAKKSIGLVYLSDSYKVGNCKWGTLDFAARHNIDLSGDKPHMPIQELAKVVEREPRREALAVLLYAIKRCARLAEPG